VPNQGSLGKKTGSWVGDFRIWWKKSKTTGR